MINFTHLTDDAFRQLAIPSIFQSFDLSVRSDENDDLAIDDLLVLDTFDHVFIGEL